MKKRPLISINNAENTLRVTWRGNGDPEENPWPLIIEMGASCLVFTEEESKFLLLALKAVIPR